MYFLFFGKTTVKALEINFISDYPIASSGEFLPSEVAIFADKYDDETNEITYLSRLSFKRLDVDRSADSILFSKSVGNESDPDETLNMFKSELATKVASANMFEPLGKVIKNLKPDTTNVRYFYLLCSNNGKVDNVVYFDDEQILKTHIRNLLASGTLFKENHRPNTVSIILVCEDGSSTELQTKPDNSPDEIEPEEVVVENTLVNAPKTSTERPKIYNAQLSQSGNTIRWNTELKKAERLTITFKSEVDGKTLKSEDVTGESDYEFSYQNSVYEGSKIKVSLSATFSDGSSIKGGANLTTTSLECH